MPIPPRPAVPRAAPARTPGAVTGYTVILATEPAAAREFFTELKQIVRDSAGGVLISMSRPVAWHGGPILGVHPRRENDPPQLLGPGIWLGPLRAPADRAALCAWLRAGPAASPPPERLRRHRLTPRRAPTMARHTTN